MVGRLADMWNSFYRTDEDWARKMGIVRAAAEAAGRDPDAIEVTTTLETPLPESDEDAEKLVARLRHLADLGVRHFVMDFGHPQSTEPILRFVEQVKRPLLELQTREIT